MNTESSNPLVSDEGIVGMTRGDKEYLFLMFGGTGLLQTNGSSRLGKISTNRNLMILVSKPV